MENSIQRYKNAQKLMPSGVSSPARAIKPYPIYIKRGSGSRLYDIDGNSYIDYCLGFGPLILGHSHPAVREAVGEQMKKGSLFGTCSEIEMEMAGKIVNTIPSIDMVRFVNTGTEATMSALRVARAYTKRDKFIKVIGGFHGAHDAVLVKGGSGILTHSLPDSPGVPRDFAKHTLLVEYNDIEGIRRTIQENPDQISAFILEPIMGNAGLILPEDGYLKVMRELTQDNDILLIFDEVITGFRFQEGSAQKHYGVVPDMTTLGKIAGGGLPIGIFGGRKDIMENVAPIGSVYQAGTFSGNPLSLAAGLATLRELENKYEALARQCKKLVKGLQEVIKDREMDGSIQIIGIESMFSQLFNKERVTNYEIASRSNKGAFHRLFWKMIEQGVYLPPSQFETHFISTVHTNEDIDDTIAAYSKSLNGYE